MSSMSETKQEVAPSEPEETVSSESKEDQNDFTMHKNNPKPKGRREIVKFKKNTWQDDGLEFSDIDTPKAKRTPRNRTPRKRTQRKRTARKRTQRKKTTTTIITKRATNQTERLTHSTCLVLQNGWMVCHRV